MVSSSISAKLYRENRGAQQRLPCFLLGEERSLPCANVSPLALSSFGPDRQEQERRSEPLLRGNFELPLLFGDS
jgi:hypothetical protein